VSPTFAKQQQRCDQGDQFMKWMLSVVVLSLSLFAWGQGGQNVPAPNPKAEAIVPSAPDKAACQQADGKDCCHHEAAAKDGEGMMACCQADAKNACCSGKDASAKGCCHGTEAMKACSGKDGKPCCGAKEAKTCCGKDAKACMRMANKDKAGKNKAADCCTGGGACCKAGAGMETAMACCRGNHGAMQNEQPASR
jgi:hypothetical protein